MLVALLRDDKVVGTVLCDTDEQYQATVRGYQNAIDITDGPPGVAIGWVHQGNQLVPPVNQVQAPSWKITKLALRERFTLGEMQGIYNAEKTNPTVQILQDNLSVATFIDLKRPDTIQGISALVLYGLLTPQRCAVILGTPPGPGEIYTG